MAHYYMNGDFLGFILYSKTKGLGTSLVCLVVVFLGVAPLYELPLYFLVMVDYKKLLVN